MTQLEDAPAAVVSTAPLAPLSAEEVSAVAAVVRDRPEYGSATRFVSIALHEPPKADVLNGKVADRQSFVVLYDRATARTVEAVVSLGGREVLSWTPIEGVQPSVMLEEFFAAEDITRKDPRWQEAVRKRGVEDFSLAMLDPWATGYDTDLARRDVADQPLPFIDRGRTNNGYAARSRSAGGRRLDRMRSSTSSHGRAAPTSAGQLRAGPDDPAQQRPRVRTLRDDVKPIEITQRRAPASRATATRSAGRVARRCGLQPARGLVLHQLSYDDRAPSAGVYRASLRRCTSLRRPAPTHRFKNGLRRGRSTAVGFLLNPLSSAATAWVRSSTSTRS
jgi:primary-amine oxidase